MISLQKCILLAQCLIYTNNLLFACATYYKVMNDCKLLWYFTPTVRKPPMYIIARIGTGIGLQFKLNKQF